MNVSRSKSRRPFGAERPFPRRCPHCGEWQVVPTKIGYDAEVRHDGRLFTFTVPDLNIPVCQACGRKIFTEKVDDQINAALRSHLHLLAPEEMRAALVRANMTQKEAAERLGIAEATLSRWLNKLQIQSRAMDNLLRVFFAFPQVRTALIGAGQDPQLGATCISGQCQGHPTQPSRSPECAPLDVRAIREGLGRSQAEFARMIGVSLSTLQNWEQGRRRPQGPARALLEVASQNPDAVTAALGQ
jgi:putative transcriptional regulator